MNVVAFPTDHRPAPEPDDAPRVPLILPLKALQKLCDRRAENPDFDVKVYSALEREARDIIAEANGGRMKAGGAFALRRLGTDPKKQIWQHALRGGLMSEVDHPTSWWLHRRPALIFAHNYGHPRKWEIGNARFRPLPLTGSWYHQSCHTGVLIGEGYDVWLADGKTLVRLE